MLGLFALLAAKPKAESEVNPNLETQGPLAEPDVARQAYEGAIARAVARKTAEDGEAHVLDLGTGTGLLALMAARAGAKSVVACDLLPPLVAAARQVELIIWGFRKT